MRTARKAVIYYHSMVKTLERYLLNEDLGAADIAQILRAHYDDRITERDVALWREQYARFDRICTMCLRDANATVTSILFAAAKDGDLPTARWWAERRNPAFMPKSKVENRNTDTLDERLKRRSAEEDIDDAFERGLIYDDDSEAQEQRRSVAKDERPVHRGTDRDRQATGLSSRRRDGPRDPS